MRTLGRVAAAILPLLPATRFFGLKRRLLRLAGLDIGARVKVCSSARFLVNGRVSVGAGSWIGHDFLAVGGQAELVLEQQCNIGPRVTIATGTHEILSQQDVAAGRGYSMDVRIGRGTWVGANATILGGSDIGECCIVAAGAVVKGAFPDRSLIGGVPAKVIRTLS